MTSFFLIKRRNNGPLNLFSEFEWSDLVATKFVADRYPPRLLFERHGLGIAGETVVIGSPRTAKVLKLIQTPCLVEDLRVNFDGTVGRKDPSASTGRKFRVYRVGSAIGA